MLLEDIRDTNIDSRSTSKLNTLVKVKVWSSICLASKLLEDGKENSTIILETKNHYRKKTKFNIEIGKKTKVQS